MANNEDSLFKKTSLFSPTTLQKILYESAPTALDSSQNFIDTNVDSTSSFRYLTHWRQGMKSTQQLPINWVNFENHTFFNSAESKVNVSFDKIINEFPFDGNKKEFEAFFDELTGYEKYIYDRFPKYRGFLHFSGTMVDETPANGFSKDLGTYISVKDSAGNIYPALSKDKTGDVVIGPNLNDSLTFEMTVFVPPQVNDNQIIAQKYYDASNHLTLGLADSSSTETCDLFFVISSGSSADSTGVLSASMQIQKGRFNYVSVVYDNFSMPTLADIKMYKTGTLFSKSRSAGTFGDFKFIASDFIIGSGSLVISGTNATTLEPEYFIPKQTLSGAIDEFRLYNTVIEKTKQKEFLYKNVYSSPDLRLYFKFNEPSGSYSNNNLVLDSSGKSLHSTITNFTSSLREVEKVIGLTGKMPIKNERAELNPILFPYVDNVMNLNKNLLLSASVYDANNPNLITKLIPPHYLMESQFTEGFSTIKGELDKPYSTGSISFPGGGKLGSSQLMSLMMLMWGKYFDELKMYTDHFSDLLSVDYDKDNTIADQFLTFLGNHYGFQLPSFYSNAGLKQYLDGENLLADPSYSQFGLRYVQNELWRRVLTNIQEIITSKGTVHSIKALIRSIGLNPDNNFRIREFGGPKSTKIQDSRRLKTDHLGMLNYSATLAPNPTAATTDTLGVHPNVPFIISPFLSASRVEVGMPSPQGPMVRSYEYAPSGGPNVSHNTFLHGISRNPDDGLFTSGSFTYEALYRFDVTSIPTSSTHFATQSLMRLNVTGTNSNLSGQHGVMFNLIAISGTVGQVGNVTTSSLFLFGRPGRIDTAAPGSIQMPTLEMVLTGVNIFDGNTWKIGWGRRCGEEIGSVISSSYFLKAAKQSYGSITEYHMSSTLFLPWTDKYASLNPERDALSKKYDSNTSGSFITIGSQSLYVDARGLYLNQDDPVVPSLSRQTRFSGEVSQIRFWSKALTDAEFKERTRNPKSLGVNNPFVNFNFTTTPTGSFERLRLDVSGDQLIKSASAGGNVVLFDYSQNFASGCRGVPWRPSTEDGHGTKVMYAMSGTGFEPNRLAFRSQRFDYSYIDPKFDERSAENKVRIRSFSNRADEIENNASATPTYNVLRSEEPQDDTRFIVENSFVQALNEDIINMFSTLDEWNNIIGNTEYLFADEYPTLENLRDIYFNRLTSRIKIKEFFEFYRWFDDSIGIIIERLLPRKTDFLGVQFTIESHMLERAKFRYDWADIFVPPRLRVKDKVVGYEDVGPGAAPQKVYENFVEISDTENTWVITIVPNSS